MSKTFQRILRLRALLEEQSRVQLERHAQRAAQIERSIAQENALSAGGRRELFSIISGVAPQGERTPENVSLISPDAKEGRSLAKTSQELAGMRKKKLQQLAKIEERRIAELSLVFHARRKERRQVETVLDHEAMRAEIARQRAEQRNLDDWFAMREVRKSRKHSRQNSAD